MELLADPSPVGTVGISRKDRSCTATLDLLHHEERTVEPLRAALKEQRARNRHRAVLEAAIGCELDLPLGLDERRNRIAPEDQPALGPDAAFDLSRLDEAFQEERWGVDAEAAARTAARRAEFALLDQWFRALRALTALA